MDKTKCAELILSRVKAGILHRTKGRCIICKKATPETQAGEIICDECRPHTDAVLR